MSTNIYEQKKEIGVLRALGLTRIRVILLFFYEAIVLVLSSCLLGMITGVIVAQTMTL
jgi:ABC-type antimicrobial peptide transport system permease subunit